MKKIISLIILLAGISVFYACRKNDNPKLPDGISKGVLPQLTQDNTKDVLIQEVADFKTSFTVGLYFPDGEKPRSTDVVVAMNGNYSNLKTLKSGIASLPAVIDITGPQLAQLFGLTPAQIATGDQFELRPIFTLNSGKVVSGFGDSVKLSNGTTAYLPPFGSDALNFPGLNLGMAYKKVCPLNVPVYGAKGTLQVADPGFYGGTYTVKVAIQGDTLFTFTDWAGEAGLVLKATLDKRTYQLNVPTQMIAATFDIYHHLTIAGKGEINPCDTTIVFSLKTTVDEGSFGTNTTTVKRVN